MEKVYGDGSRGHELYSRVPGGVSKSVLSILLGVNPPPSTPNTPRTTSYVGVSPVPRSSFMKPWANTAMALSYDAGMEKAAHSLPWARWGCPAEPGFRC